jgi:hypothetical protein
MSVNGGKATSTSMEMASVVCFQHFSDHTGTAA